MKKSIKALFTLTLSLSLALPLTAYAGTWIQDTTGWKVQCDNGTYLTSQWYQSPESKLWYYIGADGYMLVNTITPDGYYVNADGVWTEPAPTQTTQQTEPVYQEPVTQPTESQPTYTPGTIVKDANGEEIEIGILDDDQSLSPEQNEAINNSSWN